MWFKRRNNLPGLSSCSVAEFWFEICTRSLVLSSVSTKIYITDSLSYPLIWTFVQIYIYVSYFSRIKYFFKNTRIETNTKIYYLCFFYIETESVWFQFVSKPNSAAGNVLLHCFGDCIEEELLSSSNFCCFSKHHMSSQNIICSQLSFSICNCMNHWIRAIWRYQIIVMIRRNNTLSG